MLGAAERVWAHTHTLVHLVQVQLSRRRLVHLLKQAAKAHLQSQFLLQSSDEAEDRKVSAKGSGC